MVPSATSVQRMTDCDEKTTQMNSLIADIVPMLHDLGAQALQEVKAYLEVQIREAKKSLERESTRVYRKDSESR